MDTEKIYSSRVQKEGFQAQISSASLGDTLNFCECPHQDQKAPPAERRQGIRQAILKVAVGLFTSFEDCSIGSEHSECEQHHKKPEKQRQMRRLHKPKTSVLFD